MTLSTTANVKRALVQQLRSNLTLKAALVGGIHEGFSPEKPEYPLLVYHEISAPYVWLWGSLMLYTRFDVWVLHRESVGANNLDALVFSTLNDADLAVDGQSTLICRRVADMSSQDVDDEGRKIYMVGGSYLIETDQPA